MKYLYKLLFLCLLLPNIGLAQQNLVFNPSFEDYINCPVFTDSVLSVGWYSCGLSPDYYHTCANSLPSNFGVPLNWMGYQQPIDGEAYIGLYTYGTGGSAAVREFAGAQLVQPLIIGTRYYVSGYISRATAVYHECSTNNFGFRFFTKPNDYLNPAIVDNLAHVYSDVVVSDTINWVKVQGSFVADSAYEYIILGNFFDDAQTTITGCNTAQFGAAYYYIDKVCVSTDSLTCEITTGINPGHKKANINISPNPAQDLVSINFPALTGSYDVRILDFYGREVLFKTNITASQSILNIHLLDKGLFFIKITNNGQTYFLKHLKQ